jgi:phenylacetate-CoA ligase
VLRQMLLESVGFGLLDAVQGTHYRRHLELAREVTTWNESRLHEHQLAKLDALLVHATARSAHYRSLGVAQRSDPVEWLSGFPILRKPQLRELEDRLLTTDREGLVRYVTSGSSGVQATIYLTRDELALGRAVLVSWWEWTGYRLGKPLLQTGITPTRGLFKGMKDLLTRTTYLDAFGLDRATVRSVLAGFVGRRGVHLGGFASSLYVLAVVAREAGLDVRFDAAIAWGDKLFPHYQREIEETFHTRVFENYGTGEGAFIAQKKDLPYFYQYTPNVFLELVDDEGRAVPDGTIGRVLVTKLDGLAMPLIRYELGDLAVRLPRALYPARRDFAFPLLERVIGRDTDLVKTPDGKVLIVHTFTGVFEFHPEIRQFKIVQRTRDEIEIHYIPGAGLQPSGLAVIEAELRARTGSAIGMRWVRVDHIPPTRSGKPQLIESYLGGNKLS